MKNLLIALTAVAAFSGSALAADLPARTYTKAPIVVPPPPSWTGCYVGGGGGYGLWDQENTNFDDTTIPRTQITATDSAGGRGWFGTVQAGCDYQFGAAGQQFVIGAFGDYDFDSIKGSHETPFLAGTAITRAGIIPLIGSATASEKMQNAWSIGGRAGWVVTPNLMTYISGGYTQATFGSQSFFSNLAPGAALPFFLDKATYNGWFLGAGDEYALNFLPGLFWKTEYRVSEYGTKTLPFLFTATGLPTGLSDDSHKWVQTVRSELVYRFNWGGPLLAKY
jgi:outer membrane immunogenic protein